MEKALLLSTASTRKSKKKDSTIQVGKYKDGLLRDGSTFVLFKHHDNAGCDPKERPSPVRELCVESVTLFSQKAITLSHLRLHFTKAS
ncbi:hypothetical protein P5673_010221 [Acropora cervicornis]|uniref:Uncharacterized protein n=1 Tax=Acropora cervicornis TaxID=6130 RepID=A0AAD9QRB1_ACRCE|nr:hypothetical protein P5673_010221 [Acropora cervicornis]